MDTPRFLIAFYTPEPAGPTTPVAIGVLVWSPTNVAVRFRAELADQPGVVDDDLIPSVVQSPEAYKQWVRYWRKVLRAQSIPSAKNGRTCDRSTVEYFDALRASTNGNYTLQELGRIEEPVPEDKISDLLEQLYSEFVESHESTRKVPSTCIDLAYDYEKVS